MAVAGALALAGAPSVGAMDYEVNDTAGMGDGTCDATCTLRDAITTANGTPVDDTISFEFPGAGPFTIAPTTDLPALSAAGGAVEIDGTTENSYVNAPVVELDGTGVAVSNGGLVLNGNDSTVRGLSIFGFATAQVVLASGSGQSVMSNYLGVRPTGSPPSRPWATEYRCWPAAPKLGCLGRGTLCRATSTGSDHRRDVLGRGPGQHRWPRRDRADAGAERQLWDSRQRVRAERLLLQHDFWQLGAWHPSADQRGPQQVYTNRIGTNQDGDSLGNGGGGVRIEASDVRVAALAGGNNEIAFNGGAGVEITGGVDSQVLHNSIHDNVGLGIDIGADRALETPDAGDADVRAQNRQNYPVLDHLRTLKVG